MFNFEAIANNLARCNETDVKKLVKQALSQGVDPQAIFDQGLMKGMGFVGELMESEEILIPEVFMVARLMEDTFESQLKPYLVESDMKPYGKVVFATVQGDIHDIGKNLVILLLEGAGFVVSDLGVDVPPERIIEAIREQKPEMLCLSALLTTTMPMIKKTIETVSESGLRNHIAILIGGAPVDQDFADEVGADGYAPDASSATKLAKNMFSRQNHT